jgi:hypothetical protein
VAVINTGEVVGRPLEVEEAEALARGVDGEEEVLLVAAGSEGRLERADLGVDDVLRPAPLRQREGGEPCGGGEDELAVGERRRPDLRVCGGQRVRPTGRGPLRPAYP